jgi:phosphoribosyl 1,2-cyclic phosphodiesterase
VRLDDGSLIIFDAGTGIRPLGNALLSQPEPVRATLCLSHMHWDHIQGLPFFAPAYVERTQLSILGPAADHLSLEKIVAGQMKCPYFPISMRAMTANPAFTRLTDGSIFTLPGATIEAVMLNHPGRTLGYRLTANGKVLVYATDHEPFGDSAASKHLARPSCLPHLARHADVLICDAQYTPEEYLHRVGWGHSTYLDALHLARQANVKLLVLFHHNPNRTDDELDAIVAQCATWIERQGCAFTCLAAAEGRRLCL